MEKHDFAFSIGFFLLDSPIYSIQLGRIHIIVEGSILFKYFVVYKTFHQVQIRVYFGW